jgi:hypothetical protein
MDEVVGWFGFKGKARKSGMFSPGPDENESGSGMPQLM